MPNRYDLEAAPGGGMGGGMGPGMGMEDEFGYSDEAVEMALDDVGHAPDVPQDWDAQNPYLIDEGVPPAVRDVQDPEMDDMEMLPEEEGMPMEGEGMPEEPGMLDRVKQNLLEDYSMEMDGSDEYQQRAQQASRAERDVSRKMGY